MPKGKIATGKLVWGASEWLERSHGVSKNKTPILGIAAPVLGVGLKWR